MHQHAQSLTRLAKSQTQTRARYSWVNTVARYCAVTYSVLPVVYASHNNTPRLAMAACACTQWLMHTGVSLKLNITMIQEKQTNPQAATSHCQHHRVAAHIECAQFAELLETLIQHACIVAVGQVWSPHTSHRQSLDFPISPIFQPLEAAPCDLTVCSHHQRLANVELVHQLLPANRNSLNNQCHSSCLLLTTASKSSVDHWISV